MLCTFNIGNLFDLVTISPVLTSLLKIYLAIRCFGPDVSNLPVILELYKKRIDLFNKRNLTKSELLKKKTASAKPQ